MQRDALVVLRELKVIREEQSLAVVSRRLRGIATIRVVGQRVGAAARPAEDSGVEEYLPLEISCSRGK